MTDKIPQTPEELKKHLEEQIYFLQSSADAYDQGNEIEAKRMATIIRTLVHDNPKSKSKSLLEQLDMKKGKFLSTCHMYEDSPMAQRGLISTFLGGDTPAKYYAMLDDAEISKEVDFENWWNEIIFTVKDEKGEKISFSRKEIIRFVADQDGGAHVDPEIDSTYAKLSKYNLLGDLWGDGTKWESYKNPERASIRQIAHEMLKILIKDYTKKPDIKGDGYLIGNITLTFAPNEQKS